MPSSSRFSIWFICSRPFISTLMLYLFDLQKRSLRDFATKIKFSRYSSLGFTLSTVVHVAPHLSQRLKRTVSSPFTVAPTLVFSFPQYGQKMKHLRFLEVFYYFFKIFPTALASSLGSLRLDYGFKPRDYLVRSFFIERI